MVFELSIELSDTLNYQIFLELAASHQYLNYYSYFSQSRLGLAGVAKYFLNASNEERGHALKLMEMNTQREGNYQLQNLPISAIQKTSPQYINEVHQAFCEALNMEREISLHLQKLCQLAEDQNDHQLADFITEFIHEQVKAMHDLKMQIAQLERIGNNGHGLYEFDKDLNK